MTRRAAMRYALDHASGILEATLDSGWPDDPELSEEDFGKIQDAMRDISSRLGLRFARMVANDVRRERAARA